jgi:hypothetical protein
MKTEVDYLPSCSEYAKYIQIAMIKFGMLAKDVRQKYGLYTTKQWINLLSDVN